MTRVSTMCQVTTKGYLPSDCQYYSAPVQLQYVDAVGHGSPIVFEGPTETWGRCWTVYGLCAMGYFFSVTVPNQTYQRLVVRDVMRPAEEERN